MCVVNCTSQEYPPEVYLNVHLRGFSSTLDNYHHPVSVSARPWTLADLSVPVSIICYIDLASHKQLGVEISESSLSHDARLLRRKIRPCTLSDTLDESLPARPTRLSI